MADRDAAYRAAIEAIAGPEPANQLPRPTRAAAVEVKPIQWLAKGFLLDGEYHLLAAPGGSYKSTIMLAVAGAVAGGTPVLGGYAVERPRPVLILSEEDPADVLRNRLDAMIRGMGWDGSRVLENVHILSLEGASISSLQWQLHLSALADELDIGLFCMDPLADLLEGDKAETSNDLARPVVKWLRRLTRAGRTTLIIHHHVKQSDTRSGQERARGASAWANGARGVYSIAEKDSSLWLGCDKLSRAVRPKEPRELALVVEAEPDNEAMWVSASLALAHPPADWRLPDPSELTPSEVTALKALDRERDDPPTWSKWAKVANVSESTLSMARRRLLDLGFVRAVECGKHAGNPRFKYQITGSGQARLLPTSVNFDSTSIQLRRSRFQSTSTTSPPSEGGRGCEVLEEPPEVNFGSNGFHASTPTGPGLDDWEPGPEPD